MITWDILLFIAVASTILLLIQLFIYACWGVFLVIWNLPAIAYGIADLTVYLWTKVSDMGQRIASQTMTTKMVGLALGLGLLGALVIAFLRSKLWEVTKLAAKDFKKNHCSLIRYV